MRVGLAAVLVLAAASARADDPIQINCHEQPTPTVAGDHGTIAISGKCDKLVVSGNGNKIKGAYGAATIEVSGQGNAIYAYDTDKIVVTGNQNTVEYMHGYSVKTPEVSDTGKDNKIGPRKLH
jgi:hypothetical protein